MLSAMYGTCKNVNQEEVDTDLHLAGVFLIKIRLFCNKICNNVFYCKKIKKRFLC